MRHLCKVRYCTLHTSSTVLGLSRPWPLIPCRSLPLPAAPQPWCLLAQPLGAHAHRKSYKNVRISMGRLDIHTYIQTYIHTYVRTSCSILRGTSSFGISTARHGTPTDDLGTRSVATTVIDISSYRLGPGLSHLTQSCCCTGPSRNPFFCLTVWFSVDATSVTLSRIATASSYSISRRGDRNGRTGAEEGNPG
jgi:hypothetical protein